MFLHVCVILFTGGSASVHAGIPPPRQGRPPPPLARQTPPGKETPPGKADPPPPWQGRPPLARQTPPCAVHAGRYSQQAGGMHSTGMQFLLFRIFELQTMIQR